MSLKHLKLSNFKTCAVFLLEIEGNVPLHKCSTEHTHTHNVKVFRCKPQSFWKGLKEILGIQSDFLK